MAGTLNVNRLGFCSPCLAALERLRVLLMSTKLLTVESEVLYRSVFEVSGKWLEFRDLSGCESIATGPSARVAVSEVFY